MDNKLNWHDHIEYLITKLSQAAGVIYKLRKLVPHRAKMLIYNSLAASYLRYGIPAWGGTTATSLKKLQSAQNKIIRYMTNSPPMTNVSDKYHDLRIMNINELYFFEVAKFMHSVHHGYSPLAFQEYFLTIDHSYNTRTRHNVSYQIPLVRTERGKRSIRYRGIQVWAKVPDELKSLEPKQFNKQLKDYVLSTQINFDLSNNTA